MSIKVYKYFGAHCSIGDRDLKKLGQEISLSDEAALNVAAGNGMILPAVIYDTLDITEQEESLYPRPAAAHKAPHAFIVKRDKALAAFHEYWDPLLEAEVLAVHDPAQPGLFEAEEA